MRRFFLLLLVLLVPGLIRAGEVAQVVLTNQVLALPSLGIIGISEGYEFRLTVNVVDSSGTNAISFSGNEVVQWSIEGGIDGVTNVVSTGQVRNAASGQLLYVRSGLAAGSYRVKAWYDDLDTNTPAEVVAWFPLAVTGQAPNSISLSVRRIDGDYVGGVTGSYESLNVSGDLTIGGSLNVGDTIEAIDSLARTQSVLRVGDTWQGPMVGPYSNALNLGLSSNLPAERLTGSELPALSGRLLTGLDWQAVTNPPAIGAADQYITTNAWGQVGWTNQISGEFAPFDGLWPTYTPTWVQQYGGGATINSANLGAWEVGQSNGFAYAKWSSLEAVNQARVVDYYTLPDSNGAWRAAYQIAEPPMGDGGGRYMFGLGFARAAVTQEIYALVLQKSNDTTIPWSARWVTFTNAGSVSATFAGSVYGTVAAGGTIDTFMQYRWRPERGNWLLIDKPAASAVFRMGFGRGNESRITPLPYLIGASTNVPAVASHVVIVAQESTGASVTNTLMLAWRNFMVETNALWW